MIRSFADKHTEALFREGACHRNWRMIEKAALPKLDQLNNVAGISDLAVPPGNRLERLRGDREGQWSIRINDQYRLCFRWEGDDALDVCILDYH